MISETKIPVRNRTQGSVSYKLDSRLTARSWQKEGTVLYPTLEELKEVMMIPGGAYLLKNCLVIEDPEARLEVLGAEPEPEYLYGEKEIKTLLYEAEDEALLDCLDYAPQGVLELVRQYAIEKLPNSMAKIQAINEKFNINLTHMADLVKDLEGEPAEPVRELKRRTTPLQTQAITTGGVTYDFKE